MKELDEVKYFGVRHMSPGASWHLKNFLDENRPELILVEGFSDAGGVIPFLTDPDLKPPVAVLAYSKTLPLRTLIYPLALYSPEFQAFKWAAENKAASAFIDLPAGVFMGLSEKQFRGGRESLYFNIHEEVAGAAGEDDFDSHWERTYEHIDLKGAFSKMVLELGETMRLLESRDRDYFRAENMVREAYMRKKIASYIAQGVKAQNIAVIAGAYHVPSFRASEHIMTDREEAALKCIECSLTLMPYSYSRLSTQSGYGAGNRAPAYFEMLWELLEKGELADLPAVYLGRLSEMLRQKGFSVSAAHVIEAVRLSQSLASLKEGRFPVLSDLKDAAETVIGEGGKHFLEQCMYELEVGRKFGKVPENSLKTSIQEDFMRNMKELKLERYRQNISQNLKLDLREKLSVKSAKAAFSGLNRSAFLHRLNLLNIPFGQVGESDREWVENWHLNWLPESETALVEAVLLGETVKIAAAVKLNREIQDCQDVKTAALLVKKACKCALTKELSKARSLLQNLAADSSDFLSLAQTCFELSELIRFGSVRQLDTKDFIPLLKEIFAEAVLQMQFSANCDSESLKNIFAAVDSLNLTASGAGEIVDCELFENELKSICFRDDLNPSLSGYATALLLEKNILSDQELLREFCRRISPGIDADIGAGWFEGFAVRNRMLLIWKKNLWDHLSLYIDSLDEEQFKRALVFLRRTFADFAASEIKEIAVAVCSILGGGEQIQESLKKLQLSDAEMDMLDDLDL